MTKLTINGKSSNILTQNFENIANNISKYGRNNKRSENYFEPLSSKPSEKNLGKVPKI